MKILLPSLKKYLEANSDAEFKSSLQSALGSGTIRVARKTFRKAPSFLKTTVVF